MYGVDIFNFWSKLSIFSSGGDISCVLSVYVANSRSHPLQKLPCCLACQVRKIHPLIQFILALFFPRRGLLKTQSTENVSFVTSQRSQILPLSAYPFQPRHPPTIILTITPLDMSTKPSILGEAVNKRLRSVKSLDDYTVDAGHRDLMIGLGHFFFFFFKCASNAFS